MGKRWYRSLVPNYACAAVAVNAFCAPCVITRRCFETILLSNTVLFLYINHVERILKDLLIIVLNIPDSLMYSKSTSESIIQLP